MAKGQDGRKGGGRGASGAGGGGGGGASSDAPRHALKFLAPEALASAIIGKGGAVIAAMRTSCQARVALTDKDQVYPTTDARVLTVQADSEENLNEFIKQFVAKVGELAAAGNAVEAVGTEDELKIKTLVPRVSVGGLIGKGGATIKQLREESGAKIAVNDPLGSGPGADQLVALSGEAQALEQVLTEVNKQVQLTSGEAWFNSWSSTSGAIQGGGYAASYAGAAGGYAGAGAHPSSGVQTMMQVAGSLPPYVMEDSRGFALSCVVPSRLVGGLIGRGGAGTKEVQMKTGAKIGIRDIPDDPDNRSLSISGPLPCACAAYMMMMKRYLDAEAQAASSGR